MQIPEPQWQSAAGSARGMPTLAVAVLACLAACLLAGCARSGGPDASAPAAGSSGDSAQTPTGASTDATPPSDADLVSAVNSGKGPKPLSVKFRVEARPVVGMPVKIQLVLIPADQVSIGHIHASLTAGEGLLMQSPTTFDLSDLKGGAAQYQVVTVVPQQTGVLDLSATLLLQTDNATEARTYSIPLIAADNSSTP